MALSTCASQAYFATYLPCTLIKGTYTPIGGLSRKASIAPFLKRRSPQGEVLLTRTGQASSISFPGQSYPGRGPPQLNELPNITDCQSEGREFESHQRRPCRCSSGVEHLRLHGPFDLRAPARICHK